MTQTAARRCNFSSLIALAIAATACGIEPDPDGKGAVGLNQDPVPPVAECKTLELGAGNNTCLSPEELKKQGHAACESANLVLSELWLGEQCANGGHIAAKAVCCPPANAPPNPPAQCFTDVQGSPSSCKPTSTWKEYAAKACESKGFVLSDYDVSEPCGACGDGSSAANGESFRYVKYECCESPQPPQPPPPAECIAELFGSQNSCKSSSDWKVEVAAYCDKLGGYAINSFHLLEPCDNNSSDAHRFVKFECCKDASLPPPQPPPSASCIENKQYDPSACQPAEHWNKIALSDCQSHGLGLESFTASSACNEGGFQSAYWQCCKK
jgi:hypothetical protein